MVVIPRAIDFGAYARWNIRATRVTYSCAIRFWGDYQMRRLLFVVLLLVWGDVRAEPAGASSDDKITFTVGQLQDIDSLNVTVGILVIDYEIWNLIWPSLTNMAAKDFSPEPSMAESWSEQRRRPYLDLQDALRDEVE